MEETSENWSEFTRPDGTVIQCLINSGFLELVVMRSPDGSSLDVDPDYVDLSMIESGLKRSIKLH